MVLLLSTYDLGRQPFGLASPVAWLRRDQVEVTPLDLSRQALDPDLVARARLIAMYLPMHTATRLALPVLDRVHALNPEAVLAAYGLYAPLNEDLLRAHGVAHVLGPEFESDLLALALATPLPTPARTLPRLPFIQPDRRGLPAAGHYAALQMPDGTQRVVGSTDATRGCKHRCRHCPIVAVYDGQFRVVPIEVVLADIRAQVEQGARHITFADPDFLNGPTHARQIVERLHHEWPTLSYDVTIKVEHLLRHPDVLGTLVETGCLFVTSAVESVDDAVLERLEKGHTRADFVDAVELCRRMGLTMAPTFVAFTPWTTLEGYGDLLDAVEDLDLVGHVSPVQWGIRLLVTWNSRLLELPEIRDTVQPFDSRTLIHPWQHADPRVDALQAEIGHLVGRRLSHPRGDVFAAVRERLHRSLGDTPGGRAPGSRLPAPDAVGPVRATIPYLNEPWYC